MKKIGASVSGADFFLAGLASGIAAFSSAMSVSQHLFAWLCLGGSIAFSFIARQINRRMGAHAASVGPWLYVFGLLAISIATPWLNRMLPADGYPIQAIAAGWLTFMVLGGSLLALTDGPLTFQIVPSIAIFGLVGAFDTYPYASALFFVFIALAASLFFRAHARSMLNQMELALSPQSRDGLRGKALAQRAIESGAWRWMAGPEWALVSALIIISLSVFGAPAIRQTVRTVVGDARINIVPPVSSTTTSNNFKQNQGQISIGNGPTAMTDTPVFKIKFPQPDYLRGSTADVYTGSGWRRQYNRNVQSRTERMPSYERIPAMGISVNFEIEFLSGRHDTVFVPGEAVSVSSKSGTMSIRATDQLNIEPDGTVNMDGQTDRVTGLARVIGEPDVNHRSRMGYLRTQQFYTSTENVPESVVRFAESVTQTATTDLDRARVLESAIGAQCNYNLKVPPIPKGEDVVEYFLFNERQGYCDMFASSMAVCARAVGLPARVATGFIVRDDRQDEQGYYTLRDSDYHMWAEIYFEDIGWVPFDPTKYAAVVTDDAASTRARIPWDIVGIALGSAVAIVLVFRSLRALLARSTPVDPAARQRSRVQGLVIDYQRVLSRASRRPRRMNETLGEYLERVKPTLGAATSVAEDALPDLESLLFSPEMDQDRIDSVAKQLRDLRVLAKNR